MTKYEASEKNAVSVPKMPQLGNLQYSCYSRKASVYWEIFSLFIDGEIGWPVSVAERVPASVEPGSSGYLRLKSDLFRNFNGLTLFALVKGL
jgi:hypothetical protein